MTASGWELEVVADDFTSTPSFGMVVDVNDNPHMAYKNQETGSVMHTYGDGNGNLHTAFSEDDEIIYAFNNNGDWEKEVVGEGDLLSSAEISIAAGEEDVHIIYPGSEGATPINKSTSRIDGEWETQIIAEELTRYEASLIVDDAGIPHLGFITDNEVGDLFYGTLEAGEWNADEVVDEEVDPSYACDVLIDENGYPKLLYQKEVEVDEDLSLNRITEAVLENGNWNIDIIELADDPIFELDSQYNGYIAYGMRETGGVEWGADNTYSLKYLKEN